MSDFAIHFLAALSLFSFVELALYAHRKKTLQNARHILHEAKREVKEISQLPSANPHPLIQIFEDGNIIFANPVAFEKFPEIKKQNINHPVLSGLNNIMSKSETASREVKIGNTFYHQTITPAQVNNQNAFIIYCYDITDRKQYEDDLKRLNRQAEYSRMAAEKANQARGDFLANMSHELRTPMNGIIGLSDILAEENMDGPHKEMVEAINSSARSLLIVLNDILDFSKIEAGELTIETIPFDIRRVATQIEKLQKASASQKGLELETVVEDNVPMHLMGDPARLQQILNNLISNALKFTKEGSVTLTIGGTTDSSGRFITRITVTDTGIGIRKDRQEQIFAKFQQAETSTSRKYGGTGLGLAITRELTGLMGGHITLKSKEGAGSTFTVTLAMNIAGEDVYACGKNGKEKFSGSGINLQAKIMIVDDHPINLLFMRQVLQNIGFKEFDEAASGKEALELFQRNNYDLILMDCQMPEMDGFEASRRIREIETKETAPAIIAVTADAMKGAEEKCMSAGMNDYISKPVDKEKLKILLKKWISDSSLPDKKVQNNNQEVKTTKGKKQDPKTSVFDWRRLNDVAEGNESIKEKAISVFIEQANNDIIRLKSSVKTNNHEQWENASHRLYGSSSNLGATILAALCNEAQMLEKEDLLKKELFLEKIFRSYKELCEVLQSRKHAA